MHVNTYTTYMLVHIHVHVHYMLKVFQLFHIQYGDGTMPLEWIGLSKQQVNTTKLSYYTTLSLYLILSLSPSPHLLL